MPELARRRQNAADTFPSASQFSLSCWRPPEERSAASLPKEAAMMARYAGGRPSSSRRVRLVPVRHSGMDHRAVARIVLALARQMAAEADQAAEPAADDEVVSSGAEVCAGREPGTSDGSAAGSDAAAPWAGAHSGQSARGGTAVGRCAVNELVSTSPGSGSAGRCAHQRHEGAHYLAHGTSSTTSHAVTDRAGAAESDEAAAPSSSTASRAMPDRAGTAESGEATAASSVPGGAP